MLSRTWSLEAIYALVENGIAHHPKHAARVLGLSLLRDPSADDALTWAATYRGLRDLGSSVPGAAVAANELWLSEFGPRENAGTIDATQVKKVDKVTDHRIETRMPAGLSDGEVRRRLHKVYSLLLRIGRGHKRTAQRDLLDSDPEGGNPYPGDEAGAQMECNT